MKKLKIGFDISQIAHQGGVAVYTRELAQRLSKREDLEMSFFYSSLRKPYKGRLHSVKSYRLPPTLFEMLFNRWRNISIEKFLGPIDIFHSSDWIQPPTKAKRVTTYHDVIPLKYPMWSHPKIVAVHKRRLKLVEKEIDYVIAVSHATKEDLMELSGISRKKIIVIYEGVGDQFKAKSEKEIREFKDRHNLPENFILSIGGGERRNLQRVKEATKGYNLVTSGETIPWLEDSEMPLLYASAQVLLYPSLYEGFGLPIVEAMACGTPVITSNISSMPEVGGDAALYVDPTDMEDIKNKVRLVVKDEKLRKELIKKGFIQAKKFTWEKTSSQTVELYNEVVKI